MPLLWKILPAVPWPRVRLTRPANKDLDEGCHDSSLFPLIFEPMFESKDTIELVFVDGLVGMRH
jgi:hypothetical protein